MTGLWDPPAARRARDDAIEAVSVRSVPWRTAAHEALEHLARTRTTVTSDDVWQELERRGIPPPDEGRAMGAVMQRGIREGLIRPEGYTQGANPRHHADVMRVYRCLEDAA